jgi:serine/threonine protein kinase
MPWLKVLFRSIGEAICAKGLRGLAGVVPFGEVLYDVAANALDRLRQQQRAEEDWQTLEDAARAALREIKEEVHAVVAEICGLKPPAVQAQLAGYLMQVPSMVRQALKRPSDLTGMSAPLLLSLKRPEDLLPFLPARPPHFQPGDRPPGIGNWELVELLGVGGFGEVWKAQHSYFDGIAPVALKFCLDATAKDRLLKYEASVLNQVMRHGKHPGIVPLLDAYLSSNPPCLKYEYIDGGDLSGLLREWQPLPIGRRWHEATRVVWRLAGIVGSAHRLTPPIVHRDLKPANVLLQRSSGRDYTLRVTDFGIGSVAALPALREARQGTVTRGDVLAMSLRGSHTPLYASPQQIRGEPPDVRDDVHALGVIWYQLLTGDVSTGAPTGLWSEELEDAGLSKNLIRLLGACVAARPEKRPADAAVLAAQLAALLDSEGPVRLDEVDLPAQPEPPPAPPPAPTPVPRHSPSPANNLETLFKALEANPYSWLLDLTNKQIGDAGAATLANSPSLANLSVLYLSGNQIGDEGAAALAGSPYLVNLTRLILWDNRIGDAGVAALAASPNLANLTSLDLGRNRVGDAGATALAGSPHLANLNALILVSNQIGDAGAAALAASPYLANLAELKPLNNHISSAGVTALRERFGKRVRIY